MCCTKPGLLALLLLLAACATGPKQPADSSQTAEREPAAEVDAEPGAIVARVPTPNPYANQPEPDDPAVRGLQEKAAAAMAKQQWSTAEPLLLQAIAQGPNYSGLYYNLGMVYYRLNRPAEAESQWQNAIAINDKNIYAYNALALLKREAGDFAAAEQLYQKALAVWPDHADSHKNLGILYDLYLGRLSDALVSYRTFQALQPEPDRLVGVWIVDLERRLPESPAAIEAPAAETTESDQEANP